MSHLAITYLFVSMVTGRLVSAKPWVPGSNGVHVSVMNVSTGSQLEVLQTSPSAGYIQTPGWDHFNLHPQDMDSVIRVKVLPDFTIMFSILHLNLTGRKHKCDTSEVTLVLYENKMKSYDILWECRDRKPNERELLSVGSSLYVHFQCGKSRKNGFRLFFSVHEDIALIQKDTNEEWNCSVPNFREFKPHFPCDMRPQCANKEDERDCPYFSEECGLGFVTLGSYCLSFEKKPVMGSWRQAEFQCNRRQGTLVNVRRRDDYERLVSYLQPSIDVWKLLPVRIGLHSTSKFLPMMYRNEFQHSDNTIAFYKMTRSNAKVQTLCGMIRPQIYHAEYFSLGVCAATKTTDLICETRKPTTAMNSSPTKIHIQPVSNTNHSQIPPLLHCPLGHVTRDFMACDLHSRCWASHMNSCQAPLEPQPPSFTCSNGVERVPYTLVCDFRPDCSDDSDESFCEFLPCDLLDPFRCSSRQCVPRSTVCDGQKNCYNAADEDLCSNRKWEIRISPLPPAIVHLNHNGQFTVHKLSQSQLADLNSSACPETHFQCADKGYCMPVFLRCNGVYDCLDKEDEADCNSYTCPGFYRCRRSSACLHPDQLCDGIFQCPQNDDELLCDLNCPDNCTCYGLSLYCRKPFRVTNISTIRFLDAGGSGIEISDLEKNVLLIYLSMVGNGLTKLGQLRFCNLRYLDLSYNLLSVIEFHELSHLSHLEVLSLSGNPLLSLFQYTYKPEGPREVVYFEKGNGAPDLYDGQVHFKSLGTLDLSGVKMKIFDPRFLSLTPNLHAVNLSESGVDTLLGEGFQSLKHLRALDLRGCPLTHFPRNVLASLKELEIVYSDNLKICCPANLPADFLSKNCHAPHDDLSSCEALLKFNPYRIFLSIFAFLALLGNASSFSYRVFLRKKKQLYSFDVFVAHLCGSDFLMGVYLSVIGVADRLYQGTYLWEDIKWMNSAACQIAGFLCLVSSEVSALVICLITVDRFLVLRFPFSNFHFGVRSAQIVSACVWAMGGLIAAVPLVPIFSSWHFYGQTGICIPLPVRRSDSPGYTYVLGVMIVANFVFFVVTAAGQVFIYCSVHSNSISLNDTSRKSHDVTIARRLITVAMSDFLCWFPIGLVGLLAATGTSIKGEVNVAMAIFVLPVNSALNPFLYTLNILLENRRKFNEERLKKRLIAQFRSSKHKLTSDEYTLPCS